MNTDRATATATEPTMPTSANATVGVGVGVLAFGGWWAFTYLAPALLVGGRRV